MSHHNNRDDFLLWGLLGLWWIGAIEEEERAGQAEKERQEREEEARLEREREEELDARRRRYNESGY